MTFGEMIEKALIEKNLTRQAAGDLCGFSSSHLGQVINGNCGLGFEFCKKLVDGLGLDVYAAMEAYSADSKKRHEEMQKRRKEAHEKRRAIRQQILDTKVVIAQKVGPDSPNQITINSSTEQFSIEAAFSCSLCKCNIPTTNPHNFTTPEGDQFFEMVVIPPKNLGNMVKIQTCLDCGQRILNKIREFPCKSSLNCKDFTINKEVKSV